MICVVKEVLKYNQYLLESEKGELVQSIELYGMPKICVGDCININNKLLDVNFLGYTQPYAFELLNMDEQFEINQENEIEYISIMHDNKEYWLKRVYG